MIILLFSNALTPRGLSIVLLLTTGILLYPKYVRLNSPDFNVFHTAGSHALKNPSKLYTDSPDRFLYPPSASFLFTPFTLIPKWEHSRLLWYILTLACIYWMISASYVEFFVALILLRYFMINLRYGQINIFILFLILLSNRLSQNSRNNVAAISISIGSVLKLFPSVQLLDFFLKKKWRGLLTASITIILISLLPFIFWDWNTALQLYREYPQQLATKGIPLYSHNQSFLVLLLRLFHTEYFILFPGDVGYWKIIDIPIHILKGFALCIGLTLTFFTWKKVYNRNSYYDAASATGFSILFLSHIVWKPYFIFLFPAILQCLLLGKKKERVMIGIYMFLGPLFSPNLFGQLKAITLDGACIHLLASLLIFAAWMGLPRK